MVNSETKELIEQTVNETVIKIKMVGRHRLKNWKNFYGIIRRSKR